MAINPKTPGLHHVNLRCSDLDTAKKFYRDTIGFPIALEADGLFAFPVGGVFIVFKKAGEETILIPLRSAQITWPWLVNRKKSLTGLQKA